MFEKEEEMRNLLADALVDLANRSDCVAFLLLRQFESEAEAPWCLECRDSGDCWAWNSRHVLSWQEIAKAKHRFERRRRR